MGTSAPDLSEFQALSGTVKRRCPFERLDLDKQDRINLAAALALDKFDVPAGAIVKWCERRGVKISHNHVTSHRNKSCTCHVTPVQ